MNNYKMFLLEIMQYCTEVNIKKLLKLRKPLNLGTDAAISRHLPCIQPPTEEAYVLQQADEVLPAGRSGANP